MIHFLSLPWGFKHDAVYYDKAKKAHVYRGGAIVPLELRPFLPEDFSIERWHSDEANGMVLPPKKGSHKFKPRDHQLEAAKAISKAYAEGSQGFLLADKTGLGKTLSTLVGISIIAKSQGFGPKDKAKLLIVCPKGVIPQWRDTLHNYPISTALSRPLIINYQQLNKLLTAPANARVAKKARTKNRITASQGKPTIDWDYIVFDEAHYLKNYPTSAASMSAASIAKLNMPYKKDKSPFVVYSTATPGATPLNFSIMSQIIAPLISPTTKSVTPNLWGAFLETEGFAVKKGKTGWQWATEPWHGKNSDKPEEQEKYKAALKEVRIKQRRDAQRIGKGLKKKGAPFIMRSPLDLAGWPEQQFIPLPLELTAKQKPIYEEAWTTFRNYLRLTPAKSDPKGQLVQTLRYRQKASLLKVEHVVDNVIDWVEAGNQVFISVEFIETLDEYKTRLEKAGIDVAEVSGRNTAIREQERLRFQRGQAKVALCTVVAGVSFHSNEMLADGTRATPNPRITIISDIRQNNLDATQTCGRAHRDGENSLTYFPYLAGTVDEKIIYSFTNKTANMDSMTGSSIESAEALDSLFRVAAAKSRVS